MVGFLFGFLSFIRHTFQIRLVCVFVYLFVYDFHHMDEALVCSGSGCWFHRVGNLNDRTSKWGGILNCYHFFCQFNIISGVKDLTWSNENETSYTGFTGTFSICLQVNLIHNYTKLSNLQTGAYCSTFDFLSPRIQNFCRHLVSLLQTEMKTVLFCKSPHLRGNK